jgi:hypothetical protein
MRQASKEHQAGGNEARAKRFLRTDGYVLVLAMLGIVLLTNAFLVQGSAGVLFMLGALAVTLIVTLVTSEAHVGAIALASVAVAIAVIAGIAASAMGQAGNAKLDFQLITIAMGVAIAVVIARRILKHPTVSVDTVAGAAAIYLLFGLVFAVLYAFVGDLLLTFDPSVIARAGAHPSAAQAFFASSRVPMPSDFLYFSFVTLTTVGYGDLTAATQFGRMLSVTEALFGQLYLVTVVAVLVSNIRPSSKPVEASQTTM